MAEEIVLKHCNRCKAEKPRTEFYNCKRFPDGLDYSCKLCRKAMGLQTKERAKSNPEKLAALKLQIKEAKKRFREKLATDPERHERYLEMNRRRSRRRPKSKEASKRAKDRVRERLKSDPLFRERHLEKQREVGRRQYRKHAEKFKHRARSRDLRLKGVGGTHSCEAWRQLKELFGNRCLCCGEMKRLTKDHVVPVTRGGSDDITNIQPLCFPCNKAKFTQTVDYRTRAKVVLPELNAVGELIFNGDAKEKQTLEKHKTGSGFVGVYFAPKNENSVKVWRALITVDKKSIQLGRYETKEEAARAYNAAAIKYRGENTYLNAV